MGTDEERGPNGGRVTAVWFAADGTIVDDPALACSGEITETLDDGRQIRTYVGPPFDDEEGAAVHGRVDYDGDAADTMRGTWDVYMAEDDDLVLVDTLARLLRRNDWEGLSIGEQRAEVAHLTANSNAYKRGAPERLRREVEAFLGGPS